MSFTVEHKGSCKHAHHAHAPRTGILAALLLLLAPIGLILCGQCGVHVCPAELAAALEIWTQAAAALRGRAVWRR